MQEQAHVDIYRRGWSQPLAVSKRFRGTFSKTGDPYILQSYSKLDLRTGAYTLKWKLGGKSGSKALAFGREDKDWRIDVYC